MLQKAILLDYLFIGQCQEDFPATGKTGPGRQTDF